MIRFNYITQYQPPAPFVYVTIRTDDAALAVPDLPAQLDSAADRTVIPMKVIEALSAEALRTIPIEGVGGIITLMSTFVLQMEIRLLRSVTVEVVAHQDEPFVLLGRDVLNHFRVLLDGPGQAVELE